MLAKMETCGDCSFGYMRRPFIFIRKTMLVWNFLEPMESCRSRSNAQCVIMNASGMSRCGDARIHTEWRRQKKENGAVLR